MLKVAGRVARLDYAFFKTFNDRHGMEIGVMEFDFSNLSRTRVDAVRWNGKILRGTDIRVQTRSVALASVADIVTESHRAMAKVLLRPGQVKFRAELDRVYGARCCLSGCNVAWALEGAHIDSFASAPSYHAGNGLLLRRDLHALFDAQKLGIDPSSRTAVFSDEALAWPEYKAWHKVAKLAKPQAGFENDAPSAPRLKARWEQFMKAQNE
ncbi:MAG TPA: HNH endonuclease signature motif containing protein [Gemmatimonadaceae bacterium]|nr:HNH endonuclease signature motif containing protein [Gemmatimonadaceae bacterium]